MRQKDEGINSEIDVSRGNRDCAFRRCILALRHIMNYNLMETVAIQYYGSGGVSKEPAK